MPLNIAKDASVTDSPPGPAYRDGNRRRKSKSPNRIYPRRPSMERINDLQPVQLVQETELKKFPEEEIPKTTSGSILLKSEYRIFLDLYFWTFIRAGFFLGTALVFPVHYSIPLCFGLSILYSDVFIPLYHPEKGISRKVVYFMIFILLAVCLIKYQQYKSSYEPGFTKQELDAVQSRVEEQSVNLINNQVALLHRKLSKLSSEHGSNLPADIVSELVRNELQNGNTDLTPLQKQQIQTAVYQYFQKNPQRPSETVSFNQATIESLVRETISDVSQEWKRQIHSMRDSVNSLSEHALKKIISEWVEGEVKNHHLSGNPRPIDQEKLKGDVKTFEFSDKQSVVVSQMIEQELQKYVSLYSQLTRPLATISTEAGHLLSSPNPLVGQEHFGYWKVDQGQILTLNVSLTESIHPFMLVLGGNYAAKPEVTGNDNPQFWCPPTNFHLKCNDELIGSGVFSTLEPSKLFQDYSLNSSKTCSSFLLRVSPSEQCLEDKQAKVLFKFHIYGFPAK